MLPPPQEESSHLPVKSWSGAESRVVHPHKQPEDLALGHMGQDWDHRWRLFQPQCSVQLSTSWCLPGAVSEPMVMKPWEPSHSAPGSLVAQLDPPLYHTSSEPHTSSQPQLLTDAVSSPMAAVETDC